MNNESVVKIYIEIHLSGELTALSKTVQGIKNLIRSMSLLIPCVKKADVHHTRIAELERAQWHTSTSVENVARSGNIASHA